MRTKIVVKKPQKSIVDKTGLFGPAGNAPFPLA